MAEELGVQLRFDSRRYGSWQSVEIRDSVDDLCATVQLAMAGAGTGGNFKVTANTVVDVLVNDKLATTARSDMSRRRVDSRNHAIHFAGRSLGRELVDCQYSKTLSGLKLAEIVKRLCDTFKVPVKIAAETAVVEHFSMQCEVPANALINAARSANLLLYPTPAGGLILTEPSNAPPVATLEYGTHIKSYEVVDEFKLRFSDYRIKSFDYDNDQALKGGAKDDGITFFRPMHIIADRHGYGQGGCDRRALLERNRRLARAHRIDLEVKGWEHLGGLWELNTQIRVVIPDEDIDGVFLIGERSFTLDSEGGKVARLQVMHRNAFIGEEKKKSKRGAGVNGTRSGGKK
jgi:prophage tail gpP-like protein